MYNQVEKLTKANDYSSIIERNGLQLILDRYLVSLQVRVAQTQVSVAQIYYISWSVNVLIITLFCNIISCDRTFKYILLSIAMYILCSIHIAHTCN